jgi:hypothetical protein
MLEKIARYGRSYATRGYGKLRGLRVSASDALDRPSQLKYGEPGWLWSRFTYDILRSHDNRERFSLGGAAHERHRGGTHGGGRAGERKTDWTKSLPPPPVLWALKRATVPRIARSARWSRRFGAVGRAVRAAKRSTQPDSGQLASAQLLRRSAPSDFPLPDLAGGSAPRSRTIGLGS